MDYLAMARKVQSTSVGQNEFSLYGSVIDDAYEALLHKLRGFCDNSYEQPHKFHDHEMVYTISMTFILLFLDIKLIFCDFTEAPTGQTSSLRVRRSLDHPENPWNLRYLGHHDTDRNRIALARSCIDCNTTTNIIQFLNEMGFRLDFEYTLKGFMFRKGKMKILVYKVFKINNSGGMPSGLNSNDLEPITSSHLVELSVVAPSHLSSVADEMKQFADLLKPLVSLENVEMRKIA